MKPDVKTVSEILSASTTFLMKKKILIVEDEVIIADTLKLMLENLGYSVLEPVGNKKDALLALHEQKPDMAILDINLEGKPHGLDIGKFIHEEFRIPFIYLTSNSDKETISLARKTKPGSYLIKPFTSDDIYAAIEIAMANYYPSLPFEEAEDKLSILSDSLFIKVGNKFIKVNISDISYFEAERKMMHIHTLQNQSFYIRISVDNLLVQLKNFGFVRVHRSYCINLKHLSVINGDYVTVANAQIPIGRIFRDELLARVNTIM